jgi:hypothetical protein
VRGRRKRGYLDDVFAGGAGEDVLGGGVEEDLADLARGGVDARDGVEVRRDPACVPRIID